MINSDVTATVAEWRLASRALAGWLDRAAFVAVVTLAALLPFELKTPWFGVGPVVITNVELVLYMVVMSWGASRLLSGYHQPFTTVHFAVLAVAAVSIASAVTAEAPRDAALKFALRSFGGFILFFAAFDIARTPARAAVILTAISGGAVVSALTGIAELEPSVSRWLLAFKTQQYTVGGIRRVSGTFQYPNTAAMYWEAALPIVLTTGGWLAVRRHAAWRAISIVAGIAVVAAIVLSLSRAGLAVSAATLALFAGVRRAQTVGPGRIVLASLIGLVISNALAGPMALRMQSDDLAQWFRPEYVTTPSSYVAQPGESMAFAVKIRNRGLVAWQAAGANRVALGAYWEQKGFAAKTIVGGLRGEFRSDVAPGQETDLIARVVAPRVPGEYVLNWDLVQENVLWFSANGASPGGVPVHVKAEGTATETTGVAISGEEVAFPEARPPRLALWNAAIRMWSSDPLLGIGPDNFRHRWGQYVERGQFDDRVHANSWYVETLVDQGLIGLLALGVLLGTLAVRGAREWTRDTLEQQLLRLGPIVAIGCFVVHGVVDYFLPFTPTYGLFWLLAGIVSRGWEGRAE
jgi:hypothetical protein